ncbi:protein myomixer-like [Onychostoma macrolepis]|uniref:Uncharacterized protein n=1 Tax=Onychostoma macrolepis TaxID=369639 RepID=A0A7J6CGC3_9TELE|nr:protein myomixer-like [Onychostoma macrolepis]KAF4106134.1 hypothetical protein G5714_013796 [Onychostoma macrolepis]
MFLHLIEAKNLSWTTSEDHLQFWNVSLEGKIPKHADLLLINIYATFKSMPAVFLLLRSLVVSLLSSRLAASAAQLLRRSLTAAARHLGTVLRHVWERISSQESKEAILGCVLCILNMHKKVDN